MIQGYIAKSKLSDKIHYCKFAYVTYQKNEWWNFVLPGRSSIFDNRWNCFIYCNKKKKLLAGYKNYSKSIVSGNQTWHVITFNPSSASPGEQMYICVPRLSQNDCLLPNSLNLNIGYIKNYINNNFSKLHQSHLEIWYSGEVIFEVYRDKWPYKSQRDDIGTGNWEKLTSKDDNGASSGSTDKVGDALMLVFLEQNLDWSCAKFQKTSDCLFLTLWQTILNI